MKTYPMYESILVWDDALNYYDAMEDYNSDELGEMFAECITFDQDLSSWNTMSLGLQIMYACGNPFNQPIGVGSTATYSPVEWAQKQEGRMYGKPWQFTQDISSWSLSKVRDLHGKYWGYSQPAYTKLHKR